MSIEVESYVPPLDLRFKYLVVKWYLRFMNRCQDDYTVECLGLEMGANAHRSSFAEYASDIGKLMGMPVIKRVPTEIVSHVQLWDEFNKHLCFDLDV